MIKVTAGEIIETFGGLKGEVVAVYNNTVVADLSLMKDYRDYFEDPKQVIRKADIKKTFLL
ncbi:hypothetical protein AWM68_17730 [Fictibacillus phosphorivorans]|uniref:DUF2187 domain-containing protein n=1 Tax=Fictibacillus phosphorivorans TaxID=1221500 RepID=A0A163S2L9_9BACL|nr:DUF2187 family protein [Fictibacillus phosphorivorans]KZE68012.1 hypothetical protein AWM68_17730 [Fictibacillus phosphorivorans]